MLNHASTNTQFVEKDPALADPVIRLLLKFWPVTNSQKEVRASGCVPVPVCRRAADLLAAAEEATDRCKQPAGLVRNAQARCSTGAMRLRCISPVLVLDVSAAASGLCFLAHTAHTVGYTSTITYTQHT